MVTTLFASADAHHEPEANIAKVAAPGVPQTIAQYEILAQPVAPVQNVPYVQQGFFVQVVNLQAQAAAVTLNFVSTPPISGAPTAPIKAFADYIVNDGHRSSTTRSSRTPSASRASRSRRTARSSSESNISTIRRRPARRRWGRRRSNRRLRGERSPSRRASRVATASFRRSGRCSRLSTTTSTP